MSPIVGLEKEKEVFTYSIKRAREIMKFRVVVVQRPRNVQKRVMHVQSYCFVNLQFSLPFSLPSLSLLLKLPIVVIQKFCYNSSVKSYFSFFCVRRLENATHNLGIPVVLGYPVVLKGESFPSYVGIFCAIFNNSARVIYVIFANGNHAPRGE